METKNRQVGSVALSGAKPKAKATKKPSKKPPAAKITEGPPEQVLIEPSATPPAADTPELSTPKRWWKFALLATGLAIVLAAVIWTVGASAGMRFQFAGKTYATRGSDAAIEQAIKAQTAAYKLAVTYPNNSTKTFTMQQAGLYVDSAATLASAHATAHQLSSRLHWWRTVPVPLDVKISQKPFDVFLTQDASIITQPAKDASLSTSNGQVVVSNGSAGKAYGFTNPARSLTQAASTLSTRPLKLQTLALNPAITDQELASSKVELQNILQQKITFAIGTQNVTPSSSDIANWLELTPQPEKKSFDITVNSGKVASYINTVASAQIRPPRAQVNMTNADGTISVLVPGVNGVTVSNENASATQVAQNLLAAKGMQLTLPVSYAAFKTITAGDYAKWIEVDLTNKRMYAYQQSTLIKSFLVTAGAPATPTVTGQYAIYSKYVSQNMYGENVDGSSYYQPNVPWVNYFYKDYAIHGNYWRPLSYFGSINSSHGCVGVVPSDGEWIYDWAPIGTPVIVHT